MNRPLGFLFFIIRNFAAHLTIVGIGRFFMKKKIIVFAFLLSSMIVFLPAASAAVPPMSAPQIRI